MSNEKLTLTDGTLEILKLSIRDDSIVNYFRGVPEEELEHTFLKTLRVGVVCLERASNVHDLDYVRHEIEGFLHSVEKASADIPGSIQRELAGKIGTGDGQLLSSIPSIIDSLQKAVNLKCSEVRTLLENEVDPSRSTSSLGRALQQIQQLLNPSYADSIQSKLLKAVSDVSSKDGAISQSVKTVVEEAVKLLQNRLEELNNQFIGRKAAEEAVAQTTLKGLTFEEEVLELTRSWADVAGCSVTHVGPDHNAGDVLIESQKNGLMEEVTRIIIEVKDTGQLDGRKVVGDRMSQAMAAREANYGIYVKRDSTGFARELGDFSEGSSERGPWVSCTVGNLSMAFRFAFVQRRLSAIREATPQVDAIRIQGQIARIRDTLRKIKNINTQSSAAETAIGAIRSEADGLRNEIGDSLSQVEDALRLPAGTPQEERPESNDLPF